MLFLLNKLTIELSDSEVLFSEISGNRIEQFHFKFEINSALSINNQIENFLKESKLNEKQFDSQSLSWCGFRSALIPTGVFSESTPETLFRLCYGDEVPKNDIDYNRIQELGLVNVYEIPLWVKSFFVIRFPKISICHEGTHLLRGIFSRPTFRLTIALSIYKNYFTLFLAENNKLQFYSMFDYLSSDDIMYHLMFSLQQKEMIGRSCNIMLINGLGSNYQFMSELVEKIKLIQISESSNVTIEENFTTKSQELCV